MEWFNSLPLAHSLACLLCLSYVCFAAFLLDDVINDIFHIQPVAPGKQQKDEGLKYVEEQTTGADC